MENIRYIKTTNRERVINSFLSKSFIETIRYKKFEKLKDLLHDQGVYFQSKNKSEAILHLENLINLKASGKFNVYTNHGLTMDLDFVNEVIEIRFIDCINAFLYQDNYFNTKAPKFGSNPNKKIREVLFRFCFEFKDGKIYKISTPSLFKKYSTEGIHQN